MHGLSPDHCLPLIKQINNAFYENIIIKTNRTNSSKGTKYAWIIGHFLGCRLRFALQDLLQKKHHS